MQAATATGERIASLGDRSSEQIARLGDRSIAAIIDMVAMFLVPFPVIGMWLATQFGGVTSNGFQLEGAPGALAIVLVAAVDFAYLWLFEGLFGTTLGKLVMGLGVRRTTGSRPGLGRSLIRNLLRAIDGIGVYFVGFVIALTSPLHQRLGDRAAGTIVVAVPATPRTRIVAAAAVVCAIALSLAASVVLHAGAPAAAESAPHFARADLGTGQAADGSVVGASDSFASDVPQITCVWEAAGIGTDVPIRSVWVAVNVDGVAAETVLGDRALTGYNVGTFTLSPPSGGFVPGSYRLDLYLGGTLAKSLPFSISKS
jgi:uncharacterized RDD family membrane protein YckC